MKTIVLPTDFSENSQNAISYALQLYSEEARHFIFLHVYKVNDYDESSRLTPIPTQRVLEKADHEVNLQLKKLADKVKEWSPNKQHTFSFIAANKPLVTAVREEIKKHSAELVVIGTHGYTGDTEIVYGSNTVNLLEEIQSCPILAIPAHFIFQSLKEIVLAHGFQAQLTINDLNFLIELSHKFKAAIRILHISEEGGMNKRQKLNKKWLIEHFKERNTEHSFHCLEFLSIPLGIYAFTESRESDMVAFLNKKHTFYENLLFDPLYRNLAHFSKVPVLVLHQP